MTIQVKNCDYLNGLSSSTTIPDNGKAAASSSDAGRPSKTDEEAKLLTLASLVATGKFNEFVLSAQKLDFSGIPHARRAHLANCIFTACSESILAKSATSSPLAEALLQLLVSLTPNETLAHELSRGSSRQNTLLNLNYAQKINPSVSGVVFFREFMFGPGSRKHEFGYRIQSALASQGWNVSLLPLQEITHYSSSRQNDFVLVDILAFKNVSPVDFDKIRNFLSHLKCFFRKIIIIEPDPWTGLYDEMLRAVSSHVDYLWGFTADWDMTKEPGYRTKSILFPNVGGFDHLVNLRQRDLDWSTCTFNFTGSVQGYNLNRTYWILESISRNLPIEIKITQPDFDDGLDRESSLQLYAQSLASTHASLNMTTRKDGSRIITGRATEVISLNRLLIQESCAAFQHYFIDGEHFLEFNDINGLCTVVEFLRSHPKVAQMICSQGHQFYHERYSCKKLVEHIQTLL